MPATLKTKKPKGQARIYEHTENLEPVAIKEFVRQELAPVKESVNRLWQVTLGGFVILLTVIGFLFYTIFYLHGDTKADMKDLKADMNKRMDRIEDKVDRMENKMDGIEDKLDRLLQDK